MNKNNRIYFVLGGLIGLTVLLTIFAYSLPREFQYERKIDIVAQQRMIFVFIGDLKRWREWTKWNARDTDMTEQFSDPAFGVNATYSWDTFAFGNKSGQLTVTEFVPPNLMSYRLTPNGGWDESVWKIQLTPAPRQGSTITWSVSGQYPENRFWRLVAYLGQWSLPRDIERSLERLKKHAELHDAYDVYGGWEKK